VQNSIFDELFFKLLKTNQKSENHEFRKSNYTQWQPPKSDFLYYVFLNQYTGRFVCKANVILFVTNQIFTRKISPMLKAYVAILAQARA